MLKEVQFYRRLSISTVLAVVLLTLLAPVAVGATGVTGASHSLHSLKKYPIPSQSDLATALVGPATSYLALGDSLAFGYQPNKDFTHGYVSDFYQDLQKHGVKALTNLGCPGETSYTMVLGFCPDAPKGTPPQLSAALHYLATHAGHVSPVTLDIGANDVLRDFDPKTCTVNKVIFYTNLAVLDANLKVIILPLLHRALTVNGRLTGDLLVMNYYDPFQNICPNLVPYVQTLNRHIADDAKGQATVVDVFSAFGGSGAPNPSLCSYTWMCATPPDIHATNKGYEVIAKAFEDKAGY